MMQLTKIIAISVVASLLGLQAADARSLRADGSAVEVPPASFKGRQFVDSNGCVFIRAGVDGAVNWVPRVTRDRKLVCGFKPTFTAAQTTSNTASSGPQIITLTPEESAPAPVVMAKPVAQPVVKPAPVRTYTSATPHRVAVAPKTRAPVKIAAAAPVTAPVTTYMQPATAARQCAGGNAVSQRYQAHASAAVRCGPQGQTTAAVQPRRQGFSLRRKPAPVALPASALRRGQVVVEGQVPSNTRVVPRHVYEENMYAKTITKPPRGYKSVWDDDRLNPRRASQTFAGKAKMDAIWHEGTPRRLKRGSATVVAAAPASTGVRTIIASKNALAQKTMRLNTQSYVQVATYASSKDAQTVARRVKALGLPVRIGKVNRGGQTYRMVLAGPFAQTGSANAALNRARAAGYSNAKLR